MRAANEWIERLVNSARVPAAKRDEIRRELRAHVEDFVLKAREAGRDPAEIEKQALASWGDPRQIAQSFDWIYRHEWRALRVFSYTFSTMFLAGCVLAMLLSVQTGMAIGLGKPIVWVFASRHTMVEALDILASVAAYLGLVAFENIFSTGRFQKAVFLLTGVFALAMLSCAATGLQSTFLFYGLINGVFCRATQLFANRAVRVSLVVICFPLAGLVLTTLRAPVSFVDSAATCTSWFFLGLGYLVITDLASRVERAFLTRLQRIQTGF